MDLSVFVAVSKDDPLPLASLRLLVPPFQLMAASMWQVLKKQDAMHYWKVAEFVTLVMDMVPELLMYKHRTQLNLGLRARYILELCRSEQLVEPDIILSHLDKINSRHPTLVDMKESEEDEVVVNFLELIQTLLKDPEERQDFFTEVFPAEYGPQYDSDLQMLFSEFLCRLAQLLPVPDLEQTVSWLGAECSVLEDCVHSVSEPTDLKYLLQHHKHLKHLEQHVPPSSMGDSILSSLSAAPPSRVAKPTEQPNQSDLSDDTHTVSFIDDVAVEIITVTDYAEVELDVSTDIEVVMGENCFEGTDNSTVARDSLVMLHDESTMAEEVGEATQERSASGLEDLFHPAVNKDDLVSSQQKISVRPHDCPDCEKKFKFASSLIAHRVIHTGERPHRCNDCGRCFSFRQSLDRHRHTHKTGRKYNCAICRETFDSLAARTEHKQTHMEAGVYTCHQCNKKFNWELALARHQKTHTDDPNANKPTESHKDVQDGVIMGDENVSEVPVVLSVPDSHLQTDDNGDQDPEKAEVHSSERPTSEPAGITRELGNEAISLVKVRTSGRKRKPTMKIQVINLQKHMAAKRRKEVTKANPPDLKPLSFNCAEHSYGSPMVSSKDDSEMLLPRHRRGPGPAPH